MTDEPSDKQLGYLKRLGYSGETPKTKAEASSLIEKLAGAKTQSSSSKSYGGPPQSVDVSALKLDPLLKKGLDKKIGSLAADAIYSYSIVRDVCERSGITSAPAVGMIFNKVMELRD